MATSEEYGMTSGDRRKLKDLHMFLVTNVDPNEEFMSLLIEKDIFKAEMVKRIKVGHWLNEVWEQLTNDRNVF